MNHFDYDNQDRGISEETLHDHPAAVLAQDGHIHDAITGEVIV